MACCKDCGEKLKDGAKFCPNCGRKVVEDSFFTKNRIILIAAIIMAVIVVAAVSVFVMTPQSQVVTVDTVRFEIPADYVSEPSRTDVSYDEGVKSSAMGWSNNDTYIEIGVVTPSRTNFDLDAIAAGVGGSPTKMMGYTGYYQKYDEEGYSFVFPFREKVCMIYVSDYDAFDDIKVIG